MKNQKKISFRPSKKRPVKTRILIVCEGKKTEPKYFQALKEGLGLSQTIEIKPSRGTSPKNVVEYALNLLNDEADFDRVYCVFDRDAHSNYEQTLLQFDSKYKYKYKYKYKNKKNKKNKTIMAITSVPCFELWFLLHFDKYCKPSGNPVSPCKAIISKLVKKRGFEGYKRGKQADFNKLKKFQKAAISHSESIMDKHINAGRKEHEGDPRTCVHVLVKDLMELAKED